MPNYRRLWVPGGTFFFTVNLEDRTRSLLVDHIDSLRRAIAITRRSRSFDVIAICVLPDHLHCIWSLPHGETDNARRWRQIKGVFSRAVPADETSSLSRTQRGERGIWQRRFWERALRDEHDLARHIDYVHRNPVKHGLVATVREWPHSSFHRYVRDGVLTSDWCGTSDGDAVRQGAPYGDPASHVQRAPP